MRLPDVQFPIDSVVYHKLEPDKPGIVVGITVRSGGRVAYHVAWGRDDENNHYPSELTDEKGYTLPE